VTISVFVFFGNLHQLGIITALFVLFVVTGVNKVMGVESDKVLDLVLDN
jgi:hypothetical protein